jgi:hypothetical protein
MQKRNVGPQRIIFADYSFPGHPMVYESLPQVDIPEIINGKQNIELVELKAMRVQVLELLGHLKAKISAEKGHRQGLQTQRHFLCLGRKHKLVIV